MAIEYKSFLGGCAALALMLAAAPVSAAPGDRGAGFKEARSEARADRRGERRAARRAERRADGDRRRSEGRMERPATLQGDPVATRRDVRTDREAGKRDARRANGSRTVRAAPVVRDVQLERRGGGFGDRVERRAERAKDRAREIRRADRRERRLERRVDGRVDSRVGRHVDRRLNRRDIRVHRGRDGYDRRRGHVRPRIIVRPRVNYVYRPHFWNAGYRGWDNRYRQYDYGRHYRAGYGYFGPLTSSGWRVLYPWLRDNSAARHWVMWRYDANRNGRLGNSEARRANDAFERLADYDRDGYLSRWEIDDALDELRDEYRYTYARG